MFIEPNWKIFQHFDYQFNTLSLSLKCLHELKFMETVTSIHFLIFIFNRANRSDYSFLLFELNKLFSINFLPQLGFLCYLHSQRKHEVTSSLSNNSKHFLYLLSKLESTWQIFISIQSKSIIFADSLIEKNQNRISFPSSHSIFIHNWENYFRKKHFIPDH